MLPPNSAHVRSSSTMRSRRCWSKVSGSGLLPAIGGAAPTLVVSVRADDLAAGRGYAHIDGVDEPVSLSVARHIACSGNVQRVVFDGVGRIISLGSPERVFTHHQRRAISLRDGGCVIPGCRVPAPWCEIHHVKEHSRGGETHTDNGVLLCWFHHRSLDSQRLEGPDEVRGARGARAVLVGRLDELAAGDEGPDQAQGDGWAKAVSGRGVRAREPPTPDGGCRLPTIGSRRAPPRG